MKSLLYRTRDIEALPPELGHLTTAALSHHSHPPKEPGRAFSEWEAGPGVSQRRDILKSGGREGGSPVLWCYLLNSSA